MRDREGDRGREGEGEVGRERGSEGGGGSEGTEREGDRGERTRKRPRDRDRQAESGGREIGRERRGIFPVRSSRTRAGIQAPRDSTDTASSERNRFTARPAGHPALLAGNSAAAGPWLDCHSHPPAGVLGRARPFAAAVQVFNTLLANDTGRRGGCRRASRRRLLSYHRSNIIIDVLLTVFTALAGRCWRASRPRTRRGWRLSCASTV